MTNVTIVVGAQWGDEGKGKWIDFLAGDADLVARFQGGNNAGHTLYVRGERVVLHQIPSGIFNDEKISATTAGVVINPVQLMTEIKRVLNYTAVNPEKLWLSARSHVITPWHVYLDTQFEESSKSPIGTTKRGIGPTYADKANRTGLRLGDYINPIKLHAWISQRVELEPKFKIFYEKEKSQWTEFAAAAAEIAPFVCDSETRIRQKVREGKRVLLEGAQAALLDIDHGTYPYVTSSSTTAGGGIASLGIAPKRVGAVYGVAKAYLTRVGEGPVPTELTDSIGEELRRKGHEYGSTTNRPRRCGWFDAVAMAYAAEVNGFDGIFLNKMDILTGFPTLKIAVAYRHPKLGIMREFPSDLEILAEVTPVYEEYPGWTSAIPTSGLISSMPKEAVAYVRAIEKHSGVKVLRIGSGPNRDHALWAGE
jgi:adenylosuccinate synthase